MTFATCTPSSGLGLAATVGVTQTTRFTSGDGFLIFLGHSRPGSPPTGGFVRAADAPLRLPERVPGGDARARAGPGRADAQRRAGPGRSGPAGHLGTGRPGGPPSRDLRPGQRMRRLRPAPGRAPPSV